MLKRGLLLTGMLLSPQAAGAQQAMTAFELGLNYNSLVGKSVRVTDCVLAQAALEFVLCPILSASAVVGAVKVEYGRDDQAGKRKALDTCAGPEPRRECAAQVTGRVRASLVGFPVLQNAVISWR